MKKIFILLIMLLGFVSLQAQERTVSLNKGEYLDLTVQKSYSYVGTTSDHLIPTTRDTIDYIILLKNQTSEPLHFYAMFTLDTIAGADTTVSIVVQEKKFLAENYTDILAAANTSAISAETLVTKTTLGITNVRTSTIASATDHIYQMKSTDLDTVTVAARTITEVNNTLLYPRYLRFRFILNGNDATGTGIKVKRIDLLFYN